jgi:hypothetical protein
MISNKIILKEKNDFDVLEEMMSSNYGEHNIVVYPDKSNLRDIYSSYCKLLFEYNNNNNTEVNSNNNHDEMVLLIPYYETVEGVKYTLRKRAGINIEEYEKDGSLAIVDSFKAYSHSPQVDGNRDTYNITSLFRLLLNQAEFFGKSGICMISDIGPFYQFEKIEELIKYETSFPRKTNLKYKVFCSYSKDHFDILTEDQKQNLLSHHFKNLAVVNSHNN